MSLPNLHEPGDSNAQNESQFGASERSEKQLGLRALLLRPLIVMHQDPETFRLLVRHRLWLTEWFASWLGWRLKIDPRAGVARLFKIPARVNSSHPASLPGKAPLSRRRYVFLCLLLSILDREHNQTTLQILAEQLELITRGMKEIDAFDSTTGPERRAFVDALRWLLENAVLVLRDGDADRYIQSRDGNALFDINHSLIASLLSSALPPVLAGMPEMLSQENYAETEEGRKLKARHSVLRRLVDEPVLYYEELTPEQWEWLDHARGTVYRLLESDIGLQVERRKEGLLPADPTGHLTDTPFPEGGSTIKHAALLLAERISKAAKSDGSPIAHAQISLWMDGLLKRFGKSCGWSQEYTISSEGSKRLVTEALDILWAFNLVRPIDGGCWQALPAIARYAPQEPERRQSKRTRQEELF